MVELKNEQLSVVVSEKGAELQSIEPWYGIENIKQWHCFIKLCLRFIKQWRSFINH